MSTTYYSQIIYGLPLEHRRVTKHITRYDEKTGKPYQKQVSERAWVIPDSKPMIEVHVDYDETLHSGIEDFDELTEQLFHGDTDYYCAVGIAVTAAVAHDDDAVELNPVVDVVALRELLQDLASHRFSPEAVDEIMKRAKLFLISYAN